MWVLAPFFTKFSKIFLSAFVGSCFVILLIAILSEALKKMKNSLFVRCTCEQCDHADICKQAMWVSWFVSQFDFAFANDPIYLIYIYIYISDPTTFIQFPEKKC